MYFKLGSNSCTKHVKEFQWNTFYVRAATNMRLWRDTSNCRHTYLNHVIFMEHYVQFRNKHTYIHTLISESCLKLLTSQPRKLWQLVTESCDSSLVLTSITDCHVTNAAWVLINTVHWTVLKYWSANKNRGIPKMIRKFLYLPMHSVSVFMLMSEWMTDFGFNVTLTLFRSHSDENKVIYVNDNLW